MSLPKKNALKISHYEAAVTIQNYFNTIRVNTRENAY